MKFLTPEVALYLYKSTIRLCMEYCCHVWAGARNCYLELLDKLQKKNMQDCWSFTCYLSWTLGSSSKCGHFKSFYRYYFGRSSELAQLVPLPFSRGRSTRYSDRLSSVISPRCHKDFYVNSFFLRTARRWNSLPIECFPLTYDLNRFQSRMNRHLLTVGSFWRDFLYSLIILCLFFL